MQTQRSKSSLELPVTEAKRWPWVQTLPKLEKVQPETEAWSCTCRGWLWGWRNRSTTSLQHHPHGFKNASSSCLGYRVAWARSNSREVPMKSSSWKAATPRRDRDHHRIVHSMFYSSWLASRKCMRCPGRSTVNVCMNSCKGRNSSTVMSSSESLYGDQG